MHEKAKFSAFGYEQVGTQPQFVFQNLVPEINKTCLMFIFTLWRVWGGGV